MIEELFSKPILIFGCGNVLFGDDGFGPQVIDYLQHHHTLPEHVLALDAGTSIRNLLFDLLLTPEKPSHIFIIDAVSQPDRPPGELFELPLHEVPDCKTNDFSLHQFPSVNLLQELRDTAFVDVRVLAVQAKTIPPRVQPGLSAEVEAAVPEACRWLLQHIKGIS